MIAFVGRDHKQRVALVDPVSREPLEELAINRIYERRRYLHGKVRAMMALKAS